MYVYLSIQVWRSVNSMIDEQMSKEIRVVTGIFSVLKLPYNYSNYLYEKYIDNIVFSFF